MAKIKIIENSSEIGAGTRGASLGLGALKVVAHNEDAGYFGRYERFIVENENEMLNHPTDFKYAKRIDGLVNVYRNTMDILEHVMSNGDFPLVFSGDHACAGGTIAGIKRAHPNKKLGVVWIDAHADIHTPYTTPSGNIHGMPLSTALADDNLAKQINQPDKKTVELWNELKEMGGASPKVEMEDLVYIAVRDTEPAEDYLIEERNIRNYSVDEIRQRSVNVVVKEIKEKLSDCEMIYISFDVDSMDCILVSKGTGTPVENGLNPEETELFLNAFAEWDKTCCIEVVEINPCLDNKINKMAETAYQIIKEFTPKIENRI